VIGAIGDERAKLVLQSLENMHGVESVVPILQPYKLASSEVSMSKSGEGRRLCCYRRLPVVVMAGPCSVRVKSRSLKAPGW